MTAAAGTLVDVPELTTQLKREWPRWTLRAAVAVLIPFFTARLIDAVGLVPQLSGIVPVISFLRPGTDGYGLRVVMFLVLILVLVAFMLRDRTGPVLLAIASAAVIAVGFNHSKLHWTKLFSFGEYTPDEPTAMAWTWAGALLATVVTFVMVEEAFETRRHQTARGLPEEEARAVARLARVGVAAALGGGLALIVTLLALGALLTPTVTSQSLFPRLNPVFVLLGMGIVIALAVVASARRARVAAEAQEPRGAAPDDAAAPRQPRG